MMTKRKLKPPSNTGNYEILKTSWSVQGKLFFKNSTLHGVRYIAEDGRPFYEKLIWFICVTIGTVSTIVIIINLWEKFQNNPTITGLDTDFHNWDVPFPAITVCFENVTTSEIIENYIFEHLGRDATDQKELDFFADLTQLSYENWKEFTDKYSDVLNSSTLKKFSKYSIRHLILNLTIPCDELFIECKWKTDPYECCEGFFPVFTENGLCYVFNSRHYERHVPWRKGKLPKFNMKYITETDTKWSVQFSFNNVSDRYPIYVLNSDEIAGIDMQPQHMWDAHVKVMSFVVKETYTTPDTAQLNIRQRRCAFNNEIKLQVDDVYSYSACTRECRMDTAMRLCGCIPFFYPKVASYVHCSFSNMKCISQHLEEIKSVDKCSCYLSCSNPVYEVVKFNDNLWTKTYDNLECEFFSWPMVRYKREVLFGWVDLLVSFGGIAGLFLGFSLLSGVEILYYFTVRACCMVVREREELQRIQSEKAARPPISYDLSLVPYFIEPPLPGNGIDEVAKRFYVSNLLRNSEGKGKFQGKPKQVKPTPKVVAPFGIEFIN